MVELNDERYNCLTVLKKLRQLISAFGTVILVPRLKNGNIEGIKKVLYKEIKMMVLK
jgi:hypothetical protein